MVSAASLWEVAIKSGLGRTDFSVDSRLLRRGLLENGYAALDVTGVHATAVDLLPPIHKDPFDRILVAQAQIEGATLLTTRDGRALSGADPGALTVSPSHVQRLRRWRGTRAWAAGPAATRYGARRLPADDDAGGGDPEGVERLRDLPGKNACCKCRFPGRSRSRTGGRTDARGSRGSTWQAGSCSASRRNCADRDRLRHRQHQQRGLLFGVTQELRRP